MEKKEHFIKWGTYLAKAGKVITSNGIEPLSEDRNNRMDGFMIFRAKDFQMIKSVLSECPLFEEENARMEILELQSVL